MGIREQAARVLMRAGVIDAAFRLRALTTPVLSVVTHHHVCDVAPDYAFDDEVADATPAQFRARVEGLARRCTIIGVDELCRAVAGEPLPRNPAVLTFDDGYRSCHDVALPILRAAGVRAVFFVATGYLGERRLYWWERIAWIVKRARVPRLVLEFPAPRVLELGGDRRPAIRQLARLVKDTPGLDLERLLADVARAAEVEWTETIERRLADELMMTWDQVRVLRDAGMDVESHSRRHRVLATLAPAELAEDLAGSRADLERELGRRVRAIAYPVGARIAGTPALRGAVAAAGYELGFTNATGSTRFAPGVDPLDLGRVAPDRGTSTDFLLGQLAIPRLGYRPRPPATRA
jgi:peptidoglycan/xylan/chitin deacetylase (PgdA/CDA1 family)